MTSTAKLDANIYQQDDDNDDPMNNIDDYDPNIDQD